MGAEVGRTENCDGSVPEAVTDDTLKVSVPTLETVKTFWDTKPTNVESNTSVAGEALNCGAGGGALPTPETLMVSGLPTALCVTISMADFTPVETGENLTITS
jgi:hypothetical protein